MPLRTYAQVRPWAKAIREAVVKRAMPPWFVASTSVKFANDASLSANEIALIDEWVKQGAVEGPRRGQPLAQAPPSHAADLVLTMPQPVAVPAKGEMPYQFVILPQSFPHDRWVDAIEVRPASRGVVHHVVVYVREKGSPWLAGKAVGKPFAMPGATKSDILAVYAPGQPPSIFPAGMAKKIPAGADIVLQLHYTPNGRPTQDRTAVALRFSTRVPERRVLTLQIDTTNFLIPAGESGVRVSAAGTLPNDTLLLSLFPHMHLRGAAFEYAIVEPGGRIETLLLVKPYQFHWQLSYQLAEPRLLKKGTRLRCTAWYDNSLNNARNPDPTADVRYGEASSDEMMVGFFDVAVPADTDKSTFFLR
ncbi:MAG: thiol-disulfide isomerase [Acidobacteria bacterium]|nr:thiol-disulfide isomerase [Acidobacteriota bacterium]